MSKNPKKEVSSSNAVCVNGVCTFLPKNVNSGSAPVPVEKSKLATLLHGK